VVTFDFPYRLAGKSAPDPPAVLEAAWIQAWRDAAAKADGPMFAAGKSMGGRIASQVAARNGFDPAAAGLIFFGYPLHPPGKPKQRRDAHLPNIRTPMLFLHGSRDQFGSPEEMRELVKSLRSEASLEIVDGGDHSLTVRTKQKDARFEEVLDSAANWILNQAE